MLSKVDASTISKSISKTILSNNQTFSNYQFYQSKAFDDTITIPNYLPSGSLTISATYNMTEFSSGVAQAKKIGTYKNGAFQNDSINGASGNKTYSFTKTTIGGDTWRYYLNDTGTSNYIEIKRTDYIRAVYTGTLVINKTVFTRKCLPRDLKEIGNKATGTLYGFHSDKITWYTGDDE